LTFVLNRDTPGAPDVPTLLPTLNNIAQIFCGDEGIACAMPLLRMGNKAKTSQHERIENTDKEL